MKEPGERGLITLKELHALAAEMGEALQTTVVQVLHLSQLYGTAAMRKSLLKKTCIKALLQFSK